MTAPALALSALAGSAYVLGILTNVVFRRPDLCRRACCMTHQTRIAKRSALARARRKGAP